MPDGEHELIRVGVAGLVQDQRSNPVVLLKVEGSDEALPIWIGTNEAVAIDLGIQGKMFDRPLTHDLLKTTLDAVGVTVTKVAVTELRDNTFFAKIFMQRDGEVFVIDARPSDSIALALKTGAPIYVARGVLDAHKRVIPTKTVDDEDREEDDDREDVEDAEDAEGAEESGLDDELRRYLRDLNPGDF